MFKRPSKRVDVYNNRVAYKFSTRRKIIFFVVFFISFLMYLLNWSPFFKVKNIVVSVDGSCFKKDEIINESKLLGKSIIFIDEKELEVRLKKKYLCIHSIKLIKSLPATLKMEISKREPMVVVFKVFENRPRLLISNLEATSSTQEAKIDFSLDFSSIGSKFLTDNLGFIFEELANLGNDNFSMLPEVGISNEDLTLGKDLGENFSYGVVNLNKKIEELGLIKRSFKKFQDFLLVDGSPQIILKLRNDEEGVSDKMAIDKQIATLQLIWQEAKIKSSDLGIDKSEGKEIERIDLRFDKPVVVYSTKKK